MKDLGVKKEENREENRKLKLLEYNYYPDPNSSYPVPGSVAANREF